MASSLVFSSKFFSSSESPSAGHMDLQRTTCGIEQPEQKCKISAVFQGASNAGLCGAQRRPLQIKGHMDSKNLYEVLEIGPAATAKDIKRAYRKLAREIHPDQAASPEEKKKSTQMFLRIHNAYVTLSDPHDRALYDRQLSAPMRGFAGQTGSKATSKRADDI